MSIRILTLFALVIALPLAVGCNEETPKPAEDNPTKNASLPVDGDPADCPVAVATWAYHVDGMHCGNCEQSVQDLLLAQQGVANVVASRTDKTVTVTGDETKMSNDKIMQALKSFPGYTVEPADSAS